MALNRVPILSPNYSTNRGTVRLVVVHTAQGATTYQSLGSFFQNPGSGVSSHVGIDDTPGTVGEYVRRSASAWTAANANPVAIQAELCAFAEWTPQQWSTHPTMLSNCAQWIAEECAFYGLPVRLLSAAEAQGSGRGVCGHDALGSWGGNHWDPGPSFPWAEVLAMASGGAQPIPPTRGEEQMGIAAAAGDAGRLVVEVASNGDLWCKTQRRGSSSWANAKPGTNLDPNRLPAASVSSDGQMDAYATKQGGGVLHCWSQPGIADWRSETML